MLGVWTTRVAVSDNRRPGGRSRWALLGALFVARCATCCVALSAMLLAVPGASAQGSCDFGAGAFCGSDLDCDASRGLGCVAGRCQGLCEDATSGGADRLACGIGERCVRGAGIGRSRFYCQAVPFDVDLNFLDQCVSYFLSEVRPDLSGGASCSAARRLEAMLDRNQDGQFTLVDLDLCVQHFLKRVPCDAATATCPEVGQQYCTTDAECGSGLHCSPELRRCTRECGLVVTRGDRQTDALDRTCTGRFKTCDYTKGRCVSVDPTQTLCTADRDCPSGAYCFLGYCAAECYRNLDCPDGWRCGGDQRCAPSPSPGVTGARDPRELSVVFAQSRVTLGGVDRNASLPIVMMDRETGQPVTATKAAVVGYRLETTYGAREDCPRDLSALTPAERDACVVDSDEAWLTLEQPFGTLASGDASVRVALDERAVEALAPGSYEVRLRAILSNGGTTQVAVRYERPGVDGVYSGNLSVYLDAPSNRITTTKLSMQLKVEPDQTNWQSLMLANGLDPAEEFIDLTSGRRVTGYIDADDSVSISQTEGDPLRASALGSRVPVVGLVNTDRMRLIAVVDMPADFCRTTTGPCTTTTPADDGLRNPFGRAIRRKIELIGPLDLDQKRFEGVYRETVSGLAPYPVTLEGGFRLRQIRPDASSLPSAFQRSLVVGPANLDFPARSALIGDLDREIRNRCDAATLARFGVQASNPLDVLTASDFGQALAGGDSLFPAAVSFAGRVEEALRGLGPAANGAAITLSDVFAGQIRLCQQDPTPSLGCVDLNALRCGQAIHQKAIVSGWVNGGLLPFEAGGPAPAFCANGPGTGTDCPWTGSQAPNLVTFQEHNRLYREVTQALVFAAGNAVSDAFYRLYRTGGAGSAVGEASAFSFKREKLQEALSYYAQARQATLASPVTDVLFRWPAESLEGMGAVLRQLAELSRARFSTALGRADLERRLLEVGGEGQYRLVQHMAHLEYLESVWLAALERQWEGAGFVYDGNAPRILDEANALLTKIDTGTNALGLDADRVFFENADPTVNNWEYFKQRVELRLTGTSILVPSIVQTRQRAIDEMQAALQQQNTFKESILLEQLQVENALDELCGAPDTLPVACTANDQQRVAAQQCSGPSCLLSYQCDQGDGQNECSRVIQSFDRARSQAGEVACRSDGRTYAVQMGASQRLCVRGRMGALLQESVALDLQRSNTLARFQNLVRQVARQQQLIRDTQELSASAETLLQEQDGELYELQQRIQIADNIYKQAMATAEGLDCLVIVGLSNGTSCAGSLAAAGLQVAANAARDIVVFEAETAMASLQRAKEIKFTQVANEKELLSLQASLDTLLLDVENVIAEYQLLTQQLFNLRAQIQDTQQVAQRTADRSAERVTQLVDHLVGLESGNVLVRNRMVEQMSREMEALLGDLYKMTQAFVHQFNLYEEGPALRAELMQIVTLDDVQRFLVRIDQLQTTYCARNQFDCDASNNREVHQVSLRKLLFPELRPRIDPSTGRLVTVGEQFHNLITSPTFLRRVPAGLGSATEIQLPFALWLDELSRFECNHVLAAGLRGEGGTVAVNVVGQRLGSSRVRPLRYRLRRGSTDRMRACEATAGPDAIRSYIVGRDRRFATGGGNAPFVVASTELEACKNNVQLADPATRDSQACWRFFSRDRSLAAPDWTLVLPNLDREQAWVLGADLPENERPIIEDVILYFRYASRPVL